ncbi:glycerate kinase type-2 family protein [Falsiroseomonas sp. CW058]|uniref:glycerate kinase type-2 family protein n=1 Tax=Falsiroseomonas sp. CW058 TaxID=3388664 RepID=UPI003D31AA89
MAWTDAEARRALRAIFDAAVASADPRVVLAHHLPDPPIRGRVVVVGCGKSAAVMAAAVEAAWPGIDLSGVVVTRYGHGHPTRRVEVLEAAHPVPDEAGAEGARRVLAAVRGLSADDLVLFLVSGGGSALTTLPAPGLTLEELRATNRALLASGAYIGAMNCIRRHLSAFSGGRLAVAAHPARVVTLAISDVPGDDPAVIASGPTVPDPSTFEEARALVAHHRMDLPPRVAAHLAAAAEETPKPGDPRLGTVDYRFIATPMMALRAAAEAARGLGLAPLILGDALEGEARGLGQALAGIALSARAHGHPLPAPCVLLSGGETTVTIGPEGHGRGGRNAEALLGCAVALGGAPGIWALMGDTDGIDGSEANAGAFCGPDTLARARATGLDPRGMLARHDSFGLFAATGDLLETGPTLTNVNDLRAILVS